MLTKCLHPFYPFRPFYPFGITNRFIYYFCKINCLLPPVRIQEPRIGRHRIKNSDHMLSPVIKNMLSKRLGREIRYPSDCDALSIDIESATRIHIGVTTIKRLLGFVRDVRTPRMSTLDVIAGYLGYNSYDLLVGSITESNTISGFGNLEELDADCLDSGERIELRYADRRIVMEYMGEYTFRVEEIVNGKLKKGDVVKIRHLMLHYPLLMLSVVRDGTELGSYTAAKVSGLQSIVRL